MDWGIEKTLLKISGREKKDQMNQVTQTNLEDLDEEEMLIRAIAMSLEEKEEPWNMTSSTFV